MVQTASLFSQLLHEVPRNEFARLVNRHQGERHAKGFTCWAQFTAMLFCQLAHADSLREICNGLACCVGKLVHLGINRGPSKSNLSYANVHRPAAVFEDLFWTMTDRFRAQSQLGSRTHTFRFKNKLLSLDSTTISLCLSLFPWAKFRRAKGGVKAHVLLDHDDYLPAYVLISQAKMHDAKILALLRLNAGSIVAMDRAYNDYRQFARWTDGGVYFVTRMKDNAVYVVVDQRDVPVHRNIQSDDIILLTGAQAQSKCPHLLRRIVVWDPDQERDIVLLTNHLDFGATTIAAIYKERWQIELFFKALKQNLRVKSFVGTTENALRIQIWTALLALLLLKWLHHLSNAGWSLSNLASMLRLNLFTYRHLRDWLDDPFNTPPYSEAQFASNTNVGNPDELEGFYLGPPGEGLDFAPGFDPANYLTVGGLFPVQNVFFDNDLKSPRTKEVTISAGRALGNRGYAKLTYINRRASDFVEDFVTLAGGSTTVTGDDGQAFGTFSNTTWRNADELERNYDGVEFQSRYQVTDNFVIDGSYTVQIKNEGNYEGEGTNQPGGVSAAFNYPEITPENRYFPTGRLDDFQKHKIRVWGLYNLDIGAAGRVDVGGILRYNSGLAYSISTDLTPTPEQSATLAALGYVDGPGQRTVYFGGRGTETFDGYGVLDLSVTYTIPVWESLGPWFKFDLFNTFNNDKQIRSNIAVSPDPNSPVDALGIPTGYVEGPLFGEATSVDHFPQYIANLDGLRTFLMSFGFRF